MGLTFAGLVIFLLGVNGGFMHVGMELGTQLAKADSMIPALLVAFLLGVTTVLAEPAVHVLTHQVEEVTGGSVKRVLVCMFLSVAVGLAIFLSALRILVPGISLWMYLLPGFGMIAIVAMVPIVAIELLGVLYQVKMRKNTSAQSAQREGGAHE